MTKEHLIDKTATIILYKIHQESYGDIDYQTAKSQTSQMVPSWDIRCHPLYLNRGKKRN